VVTASVPDGARLDLKAARVLCADENAQGLDILGQILMGFGVQHVTRAQSAEEARRVLASQPFDLVLVDGAMGGNGHELVRWLRTSTLEPNRFAPVIVLIGQTPPCQVQSARDCGSSFVVTKPISARVLLDRIFWVGRAARMFVETESYSGPDRRFKNEGVPGGGKGRRKADLSVDVGEAREPNMSQDQIDGLMKPQKVAL
jgi:CheY-like chemotaxis protein